MEGVMSVIADFTVRADNSWLGRRLSEHLESEVRLARLVPCCEPAVLYLWISDDEVDPLVESFRDDADETSVSSIEEIDRIDEEVLVRIEIADDFDGLFAAITTSDAMVLHAVSTPERWELQLQFVGQTQLASFYQRCADEGIELSLQRIYNPGLPGDPNFEVHLTTLQRETLLEALDAGYFSVPRRTNLVELAAKLNVSDTAISQRLRRGMSTLIETTISGPRDDTTDSES